ncbi:Asp23/Gls24 family envelope stress response protein [Paludifilum halophilum]|uniref:Asp23/Gls24 family envelope stress response protein n=1 Tax=Paludifilum halophilum TaxID=1642702 RepID=A0A235BC16_9BACL|nr:Asp23/Gls24 family envelope stress response protein [Paludifilum halophilum]OYD09831.1 Asp23/Gls24 family envelope stress response protein [Paludifilum halophilum]
MANDEVQNREARVTELGKVEIAPEVIQMISGLAAIQVDGVAGTSGNVVDDLNHFLGRKSPKQGIKVELGERSRITVSIIVTYGFHIPDVGKEVQERIKTSVESMTGLAVDDVTVRIAEVRFQGEQPEHLPQDPEGSQRVQ